MTTPVTAAHPGALVISLDFELHWGVRDKHPTDGAYARNLSGARTVIPRLLDLFEEFGVAATWATVGFLFAESRAELARFAPALRPAYRDPRLTPYAEPIGEDERADPLHLAASLVRRIHGTPRQEVATHTFSHYYCGEAGQTRDTFRADLTSACAIAMQHGIRVRSIVFPRNQHNPAYDDVLRDAGIRAFRGNPQSPLWRFATADESTSVWKRLGRAADTYVPIAGPGTVAWADVAEPGGLSNVRASAFMRPHDPRLRHLEPLRLSRLRSSVRHAARARRIFHLWWHPHNFGVHQHENLRMLRGVLQEFAACRERYDMVSLSMAEVDDVVRGAPSADTRATVNADRAPAHAVGPS